MGDLSNNRFFVHRIVERLAHPLIVKGFELRVKPNVVQDQRWSTNSLIPLVLGIGADLFRFVARNNRLLQVPSQELRKPLLEPAANDNLVHKHIKKGPPLVVLVVGLENDLLFLLPPDKLKRPGPYWRASKALSLPFHLFLGDNIRIRQRQE